MAKTNDAVWIDVDLDTLSGDMRAAYEAYKVAQRAAAELRTQFEALVNKGTELPQGQKLVFGYRFGKLSAAVVVDDDRKPAKASPAKQSLADFIASQQASGRRA